MIQYEFHPAAAIFPLLEGEAFDALAADIKANGLLNPVTLYGDPAVIVDGRNRWRACQAVGVQPHFDVYEGDDPLGFVISQNIKRRQLDESQRGMCAARMANMPVGRNWGNPASLPDKATITQAEAAAAFLVSERLLRMAKTVIEKGHTLLVKAVDMGALSITAACEIIDEITDKEEQAALAALKRGDIEINLTRIRRDRRRATIIARARAEKPGLPDDAIWNVFLADPPWTDEFGVTDRAVENHYPLMSTPEIKAMGVDAIAAEDAVLFLWALPHMLHHAEEVIAAWGFEYRTHMIWSKDKMGMGQWLRNEHELLIIARRGEFPTPREEDRVGSVIEAPVGEHSAKPEIFAQMIERWYPDALKIELFCRGAPRKGWDGWGLETKPVSAAA